METAAREVFEETGLIVEDLRLFGLYSGKDSIIEYPNGDVCFGGLVVFITSKYRGELLKNSDESLEHKFFDRNSLPQDINSVNLRWIEQWRNGQEPIFIG